MFARLFLIIAVITVVVSFPKTASAIDCNGNSIDDAIDISRVVGANANSYLRIDPATGTAIPVSGIGIGFDIVAGLAFDPNTNTLYGVDTGTDQLLVFNLDTGVATAVGPLGFPSVWNLAFDSNTNTLYGIDRDIDRLITIDAATGAGTLVGAFGALGFTNVQGLAFDSNTNTLYGIDRATGQLITVDTATGSGTAVGPLGTTVFSLAFDPNTNTLYGVSTLFGSDRLLTIDTATGAGTMVGGFSSGINVGGMAFDPNTNTLYATDINGDRLLAIEPTTVDVDVVGSLGFSLVRGLAFDPNTNTLYGTETVERQLITIDVATGIGTAIEMLGFLFVNALAFDPNTSTLYGTTGGALITIDTTTGDVTGVGGLVGFSSVQGLAFDANTNTLYGTDTDTDQLITIDTTTGVGTAIGPLGFSSIEGLAFDANTNTLYGTETDEDQLITIDTATGVGTAVGAWGVFDVRGLAFIPGTSFDCNTNDVPDECDIANGTSSDCPADGVPDECVLTESGPLSPIGAGFPKVFTIPSAPEATDVVTLFFAALADLSAANEYIDVDINGVHVGRAFEIGALHCSTITDQIIVAAATFNAAVAGGDAVITMTPSATVSFCPSSFVEINLNYGILEDCNDNGIPDECEVCGDLNEDNDVDGDDFAILLDSFALNSRVVGFETCADYDGDGIVTLVDYQQWLLCYRDFIGNPLAQPPAPGNLGDMDGNGVVDGRDIQPYADVLTTSAAGLRERFVADINWDGSLDAADAGAFVELVLNNP
ncbi:MAG: hypothetical protein MI923_29160 [Phycisphaerales bacterium]|nr:hypothetical protein [Phycisphaerales bacterium]